MGERQRRTLAFYSMISPWFIVFLIFGLFPLLYGLYLSFTNFVGFNIDNLKWVGLANYVNVFSDSDAMYSLGRTLLLTAIYVPVSTLIGLLLAIMLNRNVRGLGVFRTIFYMPSIIPIVSVALIFRFMYAKNDGILNSILNHFNIPDVNWLGYDVATASLIIMLLWGAGSSLIINLAGLKGIPMDIYEAASIDGANAYQRMKAITLPLMTPIIFFNVINGLIQVLQIYVQPILLSGTRLLDTPIRPNYFYGVHAFQQIFAFQRFAYGMALLWIMFIVILVITIVVFSSSRYWVYYENGQEGK